MIILRNQNKMDEYKLRLHNGRERDCGWRKVCYNNLTNLQGIKDSKSFGGHWPSNRAHAFGSRLNSFKRVVKFQALKLEALEKWLSAQNASCRDAAAPFSKRVFVHIGIITSRISSFGEHENIGKMPSAERQCQFGGIGRQFNVIYSSIAG